MAKLGPPQSFPIGTVFLIIVMFISFLEIYLIGALSPFVSALAYTTLFLMILYVVLGNMFGSKTTGQIAFMALGIGFYYLISNFGASLPHLAIVPLSIAAGPIQFGFSINGMDLSWFFLIAFAVIVWIGRRDLVAVTKKYT